MFFGPAGTLITVFLLSCSPLFALNHKIEVIGTKLSSPSLMTPQRNICMYSKDSPKLAVCGDFWCVTLVVPTVNPVRDVRRINSRTPPLPDSS